MCLYLPLCIPIPLATAVPAPLYFGIFCSVMFLLLSFAKLSLLCQLTRNQTIDETNYQMEDARVEDAKEGVNERREERKERKRRCLLKIAGINPVWRVWERGWGMCEGCRVAMNAIDEHTFFLSLSFFYKDTKNVIYIFFFPCLSLDLFIISFRSLLHSSTVFNCFPLLIAVVEQISFHSLFHLS